MLASDRSLLNELSDPGALSICKPPGVLTRMNMVVRHVICTHQLTQNVDQSGEERVLKLDDDIRSIKIEINIHIETYKRHFLAVVVRNIVCDGEEMCEFVVFKEFVYAHAQQLTD